MNLVCGSKTLEESSISASVGWSSRDRTASLHHAWRDADARMYEDKARRRKPRPA